MRNEATWPLRGGKLGGTAPRVCRVGGNAVSLSPRENQHQSIQFSWIPEEAGGWGVPSPCPHRPGPVGAAGSHHGDKCQWWRFATNRGDPVFLSEERLRGRLPAARGVRHGDSTSPAPEQRLWPRCPGTGCDPAALGT